MGGFQSRVRRCGIYGADGKKSMTSGCILSNIHCLNNNIRDNTRDIVIVICKTQQETDNFSSDEHVISVRVLRTFEAS